MSSTINEQVEWFVPEPSVEVRQGDLLISRSLHTGQIEEICLVITADCDISKGKFGRQLACLRVVPLDEYVKTTWASKKLERLQQTELKKLREQITKWHTRLLGKESTLSSEALADWVKREEPESICRQLQVPNGDDKKVMAALTMVRQAISTLAGSATRDKLSQYVVYRATVRGQDICKCRQEVLLEAQKESESLPDDVFLLTALPQISAGGAVVLLREVVGIRYEDVCYRAADAVAENSFLRLGRLHPTFKYAISQAFGALYSRIGLPTEYESRRKDVIAALADISWE